MSLLTLEMEWTRDVSIPDVWQSLYPQFVKVFGQQTIKLSEKAIKPEKIFAQLSKPKIERAWIAAFPTSDFSTKKDFDFDTDKKRDLLELCLREGEERPLEWWDQWMKLIPSESMIYACCYRTNYLLAQKVWQPEELLRYGGDPQTRPKFFDPDLQEEIIDVSKNPGLRIKRSNYFEQVGSLMWIGPRFQERTGGSWEALKKYSWCQISEVNGLIRLQSFSRTFDSDQGEQAKRQRLLREVLFPNGQSVDPMGNDPSVPW
jgi:hypothetical protein